MRAAGRVALALGTLGAAACTSLIGLPSLPDVEADGSGGCAPTVTQIGPKQYSISKCRHVDDCYEAAAEQCGYGRFEVLDHSKSSSLVEGMNYDSGSMHMHSPSTIVQRDEMLVECW